MKYLEKMIKTLNEAGYLKGKRGPNGGNILTKSPAEISIGAVARILEGEEDPVLDCCGDISECKRAAVCLRRSIWDDAHQAMYKMLDSYTLADLIKDARLCPAQNLEGQSASTQ